MNHLLLGLWARAQGGKQPPGVSRRCHAPEKTHSQVRTICDVHSVGKNKIRSSLFLCESEIKNINCVKKKIDLLVILVSPLHFRKIRNVNAFSS